jgi:DNA polymerase-3 subunit gamma/tau
VDRLVDAGADLTEFMGGAGEMLRSLLMLQLGNDPEGLTETVRRGLEQYRDRLEPGDVVRMLRLLTDSEAALRRSANPRLAAETLLLRWAMMDRTVDLREVIAGVARGAGPAEQGGPAAPPTKSAEPRPADGPGGRVLRDATSAGRPPAPGLGPTRGPAVPLAAAWPDIVTEVRAGSRFLGEALAETTPGPVEGSSLPLLLAESNPLFAERIQAQAAAVEEVIQRHTGQPLRIRVTVAEGESAPKPRPITESSLRADRLRSFRAKDPALDTAADALDLEIVD